MGIGILPKVRESTRLAPMPELPIPAITMFLISLPGRTRSSDWPILKASPSCFVKPSIYFFVDDIVVNSPTQIYSICMSDKIKTGNKGENLAADFLIRKGFDIVVRNYRFKHSEIDLIVKRDNWLIFVEVKTRTSLNYGQPEEFVGSLKGRKVYEAAEEFIFKNDWQGHVRFDVVSVTLAGEEPQIEHFEDAIN
jgi:putative endonuclease